MHKPTSPAEAYDLAGSQSLRAAKRRWQTPRIIESEIEKTAMPGPGGSGEGATPFSVS